MPKIPKFLQKTNESRPKKKKNNSKLEESNERRIEYAKKLRGRY